MRYLVILMVTLLSACGPKKAPVACQILEMSTSYSYDGVTSVKSDLWACTMPAGAHGKTCLVYRGVNNPELYAKRCD